jgi:tetratricopeptide (TPR) repeat protein
MKCLSRVWLLAAGIPLVSGCLCVPTRLGVKDGRDVGNAPTLAASTTAKTVKTGGACFDLGEGHQAAYTVDEFVGKVAELLASSRNASAQHLVSLYPDLCQEALRRATNAEASAASMQLIAKVHDAQVGLAETPLSWAALIQERNTNPGRFAAYDAARKRAIESKTVATAELAKLAPHPLLQIDAHRLTGEALLQTEHHGKAAVEFTEALKLTLANYAYQTVQLELMLGEAKRRDSQIEQAVGTWQQAIMLAGQLAVSGAPIADPILWESASALRPVNTAWPDPVMASVVPVGTVRRTPGADEAYLWKRVGHWRLDRGEPQAALLAFKRAESMCAEPSLQDELQILQALALAQLGQSAAAAEILSPLVDKPRPVISASALATLGALKLQVGAGPQALALLKKAFEVAQSANWPSRAVAEADLGLACLMAGEVTTGIDSLHAAQQKFAASGDVLLLRNCIENEAAYWKRVGNAAESDHLRSRLDAVERDGIRMPRVS